MASPSMLRSTHPANQNWLYYWWGEQKDITGYGLAYLVRSTVNNGGRVCLLPLDAVPAGAGDIEPGDQCGRDKDTGKCKHTRIPPDRYFGSPPVATPDPPPIEPPPVDPPHIDPPPVDPPPPVVNHTYRIKTITRTKAFPTVVFFGVASGLPGKLVSPGGYREQTFTTGNKPEFGQGGTEAGAGIIAGDHTLIIGNDTFTVAVDGEYTKIEFEPATGEPEQDAVIATGYMDLSKALRVMAAANEIARRVVGKDVFRVDV